MPCGISSGATAGKASSAFLTADGTVLKDLLDVAVKAGQVFPSRATIAKHAGCWEHTVRNALVWLRVNGFLTWQQLGMSAQRTWRADAPTGQQRLHDRARGPGEDRRCNSQLWEQPQKFRVAQTTQPYSQVPRQAEPPSRRQLSSIPQPATAIAEPTTWAFR